MAVEPKVHLEPVQTADQGPIDAERCCPPAELSSCCAPEAKPSCCTASSEEGCGCR